MHYWGDGFEYFGEVGQAADEIGKFCRKWGRISVTQTKEKYGTSRVYCGFGFSTFFSVTHPGYVYSRYPAWLWKLNCGFSFSKVGQLFWRAVNSIIVPYQLWVYNLAYSRAFKKYPFIFAEIYYGADYQEYIKLSSQSLPLYVDYLRKYNDELVERINALEEQNESNTGKTSSN